ncbi:glycosyltransferase [Bacteroidota bacterium]
MKILFINISDIQGGSAKAAFRLGHALEKDYKTENLFLVRTKKSDADNVLQTRQNKFRYLVERCINIGMNLLGLQYQWLPFSPKFILRKAREFKPDVISLQNTIGGYFRTKDLIKLSQIAPIVWTLHDMWAFTGNAAHTFGDESWKEMKTGPGEARIFPWIGINRGCRLLKQKKEVYQKSNLTIVTPSKWMYDLAKASPVFDGKEIHQFYHGIDTKIFRPLDKEEVRNEIGIPFDAKVLMFSSEKLKGSQWKGGGDLISILQKVDRQTKETIHVIALGKGNLQELKKLKNLKIHNPGFIESENELAKYYSAADLLIYPTRADSFGLVLAEANACGTPAVTFEIGGCKEVIINDISGYVIPPFDTDKFANEIVSLLSQKKKLEILSKNSVKHVCNNFNIEDMAEQYFNLLSKKA